MLTHNDLKKGIIAVIDGEPYEIIESQSVKMAQRRPIIQSKIKNLITGRTTERNFQQGDTFEEAELIKLEKKFLYFHKDRYFFCDADNPSKRFDLSLEQIGQGAKFLKPNQIMEVVTFQDKIIKISLPIKIQLKVIEAPPGVMGDRAQGGTKSVTLESGAQINVPLFIEQDDVIEINTETGEYTKRVEAE
ncbi:MAG: elongation factor P [Patescibacteria group bacterium]